MKNENLTHMLRIKKIFLIILVPNFALVLLNQNPSLISFLIFALFNSLLFFYILKLKYKKINDHKYQISEKQNLLRVVAHDLANPLTLVLSYAQMIKNNAPIDSVQYLHSTRIENAAHEICLILNTVKELEAYSSGKRKLHFEEIYLSKSISNVCHTFENIMNEKKINIHIDCTEDITIKTHQVLFENQVLCNILSNAIKFSKKSSSIEIRAINYQPNAIKLTIKDYGIGIPKEVINKLFNPIEATTRPGTQGEIGTGFGLPIAMKFCSLMNIKLSVTSQTKEESSQETGTTFELLCHL